MFPVPRFGGDDGVQNLGLLRKPHVKAPLLLLAPRPILLDFPVQGTLCLCRENGGDDGVRTHDPLLAGQVLSQLSYTPILTGSFLFKDLSDP